MTPARRATLWKAHLAGASVLAALLCLAAGVALRHVPSASPLGPVARIFDSLAPAFLTLALLAALLAVLLGLRWLGGALAVIAVAGGGHLVADHMRLSLPLVPDRAANVRVLFFNAFGDNAAWGDRIVTAILEAEADVVVIAEAEAIYPALDRLREAYAFVSPCSFETCGLLVATRRDPLRFWRLTLNEVWEDRYAVTELEATDGTRVFVAASHLVKPFLSGISEPELARLAAQYDWLAGPVVAVGDFNAAPWSQPMRRLLRQTGFRALRWPPGTWPAGAGRWGVPIDQVLVHDGARIVRVTPFGEGLNSNHRGLLAEIFLPRASRP